MRSVGSKKTKPEMLVRRALHTIGYRFRTNSKALPGSPDLAFTARKKAIFVHGCFWHRHSNCRLATTPKTRAEFWENKFSHNVERDARKVAELESLGWEVIAVWECETRQMDTVLPRVVEFLGKPRVMER
ncbi:DNA mismatch endonuclease Vsr [Aurantimonas endophytica]|nr:DNA mismatch endonuclease Vsr [Aurantimonas endophytica]